MALRQASLNKGSNGQLFQFVSSLPSGNVNLFNILVRNADMAPGASDGDFAAEALRRAGELESEWQAKLQ